MKRGSFGSTLSAGVGDIVLVFSSLFIVPAALGAHSGASTTSQCSATLQPCDTFWVMFNAISGQIVGVAAQPSYLHDDNFTIGENDSLSAIPVNESTGISVACAFQSGQPVPWAVDPATLQIVRTDGSA